MQDSKIGKSILPTTGLHMNKKVINMIHNMRSIVQKTMVSLNSYKKLSLFTNNDYIHAQEILQKIYRDLDNVNKLAEENINDIVLNKIQSITNDISGVIRNYGTQSVEDMLSVCFGDNYISDYISSLDSISLDKFEVIKKYAKPFGYKITQDSSKNEKVNTLDSFDLLKSNQPFAAKVYGIKIAFSNSNDQKILVMNCIVDDILIDCVNSLFLNDKILQLTSCQPNYEVDDRKSYDQFIKCLTIKDLLVYSVDEIKNKYVGHYNQSKIIKQTPLSQVAKEFLICESYNKRNILLQLLIRSNEHEFQYLACLLFQIMSSENDSGIDTLEQTAILDSLPWNCRRFFRDALNQTISYTNDISEYENPKIPFEQQICLMKVPHGVKEKAMIKLHEIKSKSDDVGSKSRHYLEGLLKIPFGVYREEPILNKTKDSIIQFSYIVNKIQTQYIEFPIKEKYTSMEVRRFAQVILDKHRTSLKHILTDGKRDKLIHNIYKINEFIHNNHIDYPKISCLRRKSESLKKDIETFTSVNDTILLEIAKNCCDHQNICDSITLVDEKLAIINQNTTMVESYIKDVRTTLDGSVHGHNNAKRQIERIIGQWLNGESGGYCFGFEGPPGVGKTSLAKKGISQCLKDDDGITRPFAFIAVGGSSNSSTLDGHNYTYVGSTWGRIVDVLIESKCMNPIIFIDELDKVSKTEQGREIIGILTHLVDPTQNSSFQDKYFSGIDIDLSKVLFIFSYNNADEIDKILLDRIHRIKFNHLTQKDKMTITRDYLIPEILKKLGLEGMIVIDDNVISHIIQKYTHESGVRKLKELLFEIVGEINLSLLQNSSTDIYPMPITVTIDDITNTYLKDFQESNIKQTHSIPTVGLVSGLWANSNGQGGILPIEASWMPSAIFLEMKLTGMQGDVMKESMNVAKTLAYKLACEYKGFVKNDKGIHIHVPEGATPKDGPSAGAAITTVIYSLLTNRTIKPDVAITGEICLQGTITAIGGLDLKIIGGISAGIKTFIYPSDNLTDYKLFTHRYPDIKDITFISVSSIQEVFDIVLI